MVNEKVKKYFVLFQITFKCNQKCAFCNAPKTSKELSIKEIKNIIEGFKETNEIGEVVFTGGEPTIHPQLIEAIKYSKALGFKTRIITNGIKLSDKNFTQNLVEAGLDTFHISIQSHKKEIHDSLTNSNGSFEKVMNGIENALSFDKEVCTITTINRYNMNHLCDFVLFMFKKFPKLKYTLFNFLDPINEALKNREIIPKLTDCEIELTKLANLARKGKPIQIGGTPLCYLDNYTKASSESYDIENDYGYYVYDLENQRFFGGKTMDKVNLIHKKSGNCDFCPKKKVCSGVELDYFNLHGTGELYPIF